MQVQVCLKDAEGVDEFKRALRQIADAKGMEFADRSAEAETELRDLKVKEAASWFPLIVVGLSGPKNLYVGGSNAGLSPHQVGLGFSPNTDAGRAFAKRTVHRLRQNWTVEIIPNNRGMAALRNCPS